MAVFKKHEWLGIPLWIPMFAVFILFLLLGVSFLPELFATTLAWIFIFSPIWGPLVLLAFWWTRWRKYIRAKFIAQQKPVLLEIKVPRQIYKTPRAMELVFTGLCVGPGETTFIHRWWMGRVRPWWSLEFACFEGKFHFYIWTWERMRDFTESQFYAQYPDIEINEVEDYTAGVKYDPSINGVWGAEYTFAKPDAYPIKTYIDFELDQDPRKVEQTADPLSGVFEKLSALGPGEQMWVQIIIRQNKGPSQRRTFWGARRAWKDEARDVIEDIYDKAKPKSKDIYTSEISEGYPLLKPAEVATIKALERSIEKPGFDVGIRAVYIPHTKQFKPQRISPYLSNLWNSFASGHLNKFKTGDRWHSHLDYPWQDPFGLRSRLWSHQVIDAYRRRAMFHSPYERPRMVLTTEELATIYHFPSEETKAPGIERITSTKGEAPSNLPI